MSLTLTTQGGFAQFKVRYTDRNGRRRSYNLVTNPNPRTQRGLNIGHTRISRKEWSAWGGLQNPRLFRKMNSKGTWTYWRMA